MNINREDMGSVVLNGFIYAIGGLSHNAYLNTVERYDIANDEWSMVSAFQLKFTRLLPTI